MKKNIFLLLLCLLLVFTNNIFAAGSNEAQQDTVVLTMGSWRADDVEAMNNLLDAYKKVAPNVEIDFKPTNPADYNATLRLQLDSGTGPDLMYARSYAPGIELYQAGFFEDCSDIEGLSNFTDSNKAPWRAPDGKMFAVPFAAVSHGVYYNKDLFKKANVQVPTTWEEFLTACKKLQDNGITPLANGLADEWDIFETFFLGALPNYIGGATERVKYEQGELKLNNDKFIKAFSAMRDVAQYCPKGFESVTYNDSQALFATSKAAMFIDGSWSVGVYGDVGFDWGIFAIPAPKGNATAICFHPDMAITMNTATKYPKEAKAFLSWLCTVEGATTASKYLPAGFFPMINAPIEIELKQANEFLALNEGKQTDARFVWPVLLELYTPMDQAVIKVMKKEITPTQAANEIQKDYENLNL
ncbi:MAG: ABC transporter substrate-binding protein [Pleomorphochaeta sp.]|jgi:raffinose/stachyose/melibiose transport system substrate-binding protein